MHFVTLTRSSTIRMALVFTVALLGGCYHDDTTDDANVANAATYPAGILDDSASLAGTAGIFPIRSANQDETCCFVSRDVRFIVNARATTTTLQMDLYVPTQQPWEGDPGTVTLLGKRNVAFDHVQLKPGAQSIRLRLPTGMEKNGKLQVRLIFSGARVPKDVGVNGDIRNLSAIVARVSTD